MSTEADPTVHLKDIYASACAITCNKLSSFCSQTSVGMNFLSVLLLCQKTATNRQKDRHCAQQTHNASGAYLVGAGIKLVGKENELGTDGPSL